MKSHHRFVCGSAALLSGMLLAVLPAGIALAHGGNPGHSHNNGRHSHKGALFVSPAGSAGAKPISFVRDRGVHQDPVGRRMSPPREVDRGGLQGNVYGGRGRVLAAHPQGPRRHDQRYRDAAAPVRSTRTKRPGVAPCLAGVTIRSSHVSIEGFTVTGAIGEGILATGTLKGGSISDVSIKDNRVVGNNVGGIPPSPNSPYPQCAASGQIPGDCGEGIHLMGVAHSVVAGNHVSANEGGVLLTDEFGPTHGNLVEDNTSPGTPSTAA